MPFILKIQMIDFANVLHRLLALKGFGANSISFHSFMQKVIYIQCGSANTFREFFRFTIFYRFYFTTHLIYDTAYFI